MKLDPEIKREFFKRYKLSNRRLSHEKILKIFEFILTHFEVEVMNTMEYNCNYDYYILDKNDKCGDEECPLCGCGWTMCDAILGFAANEKAMSNLDFYDDVKWLLMNPIEQHLYCLKGDRE